MIQKPNGSTHWVFPRKPVGRKIKRRYVCDIETWGLYASRFAFGCIIDIDTKEEHTFYTAEGMRAFFEWYAPCDVYAHNGTGFDYWSWISKLEGYTAKKLCRNTDILQMEIEKVTYYDTKFLFPMRLAQLGDAMQMPKGETPIDFIEGNVRPINDLDIEYCLRDCRILVSALLGLQDSYAEWNGLPAGSVSLPLTTASMAYRTFCNTSWPKHWSYKNKKKNKIVQRGNCKAWFNNTSQKAYFGGRTEIFTDPGSKVYDIISYDANSMFPSAQIAPNMYPDILRCTRIGPTFSSLQHHLEREDRVCWADVDLVAIDEDAPRMMPNRINKRMNWKLNAYSGWLAEPELKYALENGWIVEKLRHLNSAEAINPFEDFVNYFYNLRMDMKRNGDPREVFVKLLLNSGYGRWGMKPYEKRIENPDEILKAQEKPEYEERYVQRFYDPVNLEMPYLLDMKALERTPESQWFGFASFITSHARVAQMKAITAAGEHVLYTDTDSVHLHTKGRKEFEKHISLGDELGEWKLETPTPLHSGIYYEPKAYTHFDRNGKRIQVKHKGVTLKDHTGKWLENAGDLTKIQNSISTVKLYSALRRKLIPGEKIETEKISKRYYDGNL